MPRGRKPREGARLNKPVILALLDRDEHNVAWLARKLRVHWTLPYKWMDGTRSCSVEQAQQVAAALRFPVDLIADLTAVTGEGAAEPELERVAS